jgi:hypothetical protein
VLPVVLMIVGIKGGLLYIGWQPLELNSLISSMISANVFLLGFLISGAMPDYKEAEKLPGEMAASLDSITDECLSLWKQKKLPAAKAGLKKVQDLIEGIHDWFHNRTTSTELMDEVRSLNDVFVALEPHTPANFIVRIKQEQANLRRLLTRTHTIRETTFLQSAYAVAELFTLLMLVTLICVSFTKPETGLWLTGLTSFLLVYMLVLIHDLDNPFSYTASEKDLDEVSLRPLEVIKNKIASSIKTSK